MQLADALELRAFSQALALLIGPIVNAEAAASHINFSSGPAHVDQVSLNAQLPCTETACAPKLDYQSCVISSHSDVGMNEAQIENLVTQICSKQVKAVASKLGCIDKRVSSLEEGNRLVPEDSTSTYELIFVSETRRIEDNMRSFCVQQFNESALRFQQQMNSNNEKLLPRLSRSLPRRCNTDRLNTPSKPLSITILILCSFLI